MAVASRPRLRPNSMASRKARRTLRLGFSVSNLSTPRQTRWSPHWPVLSFRFCFSLRKRFSGLGLGLSRSLGLACARPGGHLVGRFCRRPPSPRTRRTHPDTGCLQIAARCFSTHPGLLLDAPQRPSQSSQGYYLLSFRFAQDVAHIDEGYNALRRINVPGLILVGRFSSDPHWPLLSDP